MRNLFKHPVILPSILISLATLLRIGLSILGWPSTNGDESMMNLMAMHISQGRELPLFFYGNYYLGPFEAYVAVPLYRIFGPSVFAMRLGTIGLYALFLACLYTFVARLYNRRFALFILAFLTLGSPAMLHHRTEAVGYSHLPLLVTLLFLVAYALAAGHWSWQRKAALYVTWGIVAGVAIWSHAITAPYVATSGLLIVVWRFHEMLRYGAWIVAAGLIIGAFPLLWHNLHAGAGESTLSEIIKMTQAGQIGDYKLWDHVLPTFLVSMPLATGLWSDCFAQRISTSYPSVPSLDYLHCTEQALWASGYSVLLIASIGLAIIGLRRAFHKSPGQAIKQSTRLLLLLAALLTLISYIRGGAPLLDPVSNNRYLTCTWLSLPAIIWPLWIKTRTWNVRALLILLLIMPLQGTIMILRDIPNARSENNRIVSLRDYLENRGITRFYSEYWICNRLIFSSRERLICADTVPVSGKLLYGYNRYEPYKDQPAKAKSKVLVYPSNTPWLQEAESMLKRQGIAYEREEIVGYAVLRAGKPIRVQ